MSTIPSNRVFWTVIEAPGVRAGPIPVGVWSMIEDDLPINCSQAWAVGAPIDRDRLAVCAVARSELDSEQETITPANVPDFIAAEPCVFNFLVGEYEPGSVRRARLRRHLAAAACAVLAVSLVAVGLYRRADVWRAEALAARESLRSTVSSLATSAMWTKDDLALELLQRQQSTPSEVTQPADAVRALAGVIARWPTQVPTKPQAISATGSAATISVTVPGDAQAFLASLKPPAGWTLEEPRLVALDQSTRLNLELHRLSEGGPR